VQCRLCDRWRSHPPVVAAMLRLPAVRFTCEMANTWDPQVKDCESAGDLDDLHSLLRPTPGGERGERRAWRCELAATYDHDLIVTFTVARMLYCGYKPVVEQRLGGVVQPDLNTLGGGMVVRVLGGWRLLRNSCAQRRLLLARWAVRAAGALLRHVHQRLVPGRRVPYMCRVP
jgi:hypothetical protein